MYHVPPHITFELRDNFNRREIAEKNHPINRFQCKRAQPSLY